MVRPTVRLLGASVRLQVPTDVPPNSVHLDSSFVGCYFLKDAMKDGTAVVVERYPFSH
jgi:hypothetical protein